MASIDFLGNDGEISEEFGKFIIKGTINFYKNNMSRKVRGAKKGAPPIICDHDFLNFKNIKGVLFKNLDSNLFKWGNIYDLLGNINSHEANFRANYEWDFMEYIYKQKFKKVPGIYRVSQDRYDKSFITDFFSFTNPPSSSYLAIENYNNKDLELDEFTIALEEGLYLNFDVEDLSFYYDTDKHLNTNDDNLFYYILKLLANYTNKNFEKNKIHIVYKGDYGFDKTSFAVKKINISINDNYNDDFKKISSIIIKQLNDKKRTGLYILNGEPGTGKTSWIRYLSGKVNRNIIFVSPDMVDYITDPQFIPFLMNNSDSILIIEDAEPALQKRDGTERSGAISNILNLTDGLLSDCLNISIVATFNTSTKVIDDALLRKGRLVQSYTFERLVAHKSESLLKKLGNKDVKVEKSMTLSDIYFYEEDNRSEIFTKKKVGF